jgi:hypothetical protein
MKTRRYLNLIFSYFRKAQPETRASRNHESFLLLFCKKEALASFKKFFLAGKNQTTFLTNSCPGGSG